MAAYYVLLNLHVLCACIWTGGHLVLAATVLPRALRERRASIVLDFEQGFERLGIPALVVQVGTGLWLAHRVLGSPEAWLGSSPVARVIQFKLLLLAATLGLAVHARFRLLPRLRDDNLPALAAHILAVTALAVIFAVAGASVRLGGFPVFGP